MGDPVKASARPATPAPSWSPRAVIAGLSTVAVLFLVFATSTKVYFLRQYAGGTVLWNASEADFFLKSSRQGHSVSYLGYPWFLAKEYLGAVEPPDEESASLVIITATADKVERHSVRLDRTVWGPGSDPDRFTAVNGVIYANCPMLDGLCRWTGDHFERAAADERGRIGDSMAFTYADLQGPTDGWSRREFGAGPGAPSFKIGFKDGTQISIKDVVGPRSQDGMVSIYIELPERPSTKIAEFYARFGRVPRLDYRRALQPSN